MSGELVEKEVGRGEWRDLKIIIINKSKESNQKIIIIIIIHDQFWGLQLVSGVLPHNSVFEI